MKCFNHMKKFACVLVVLAIHALAHASNPVSFSLAEYHAKQERECLFAEKKAMPQVIYTHCHSMRLILNNFYNQRNRYQQNGSFLSSYEIKFKKYGEKIASLEREINAYDYPVIQFTNEECAVDNELRACARELDMYKQSIQDALQLIGQAQQTIVQAKKRMEEEKNLLLASQLSLSQSRRSSVQLSPVPLVIPTTPDAQHAVLQEEASFSSTPQASLSACTPPSIREKSKKLFAEINTFVAQDNEEAQSRQELEVQCQHYLEQLEQLKEERRFVDQSMPYINAKQAVEAFARNLQTSPVAQERVQSLSSHVQKKASASAGKIATLFKSISGLFFNDDYDSQQTESDEE